MNSNTTLNTLDEAEIEALRQQLKASIAGMGEIDVFGGCTCQQSSSHTSHADCSSHSSHCDADGWG